MTNDELMRPVEVARLFQVNPRTVGRWAIDKRLRSITTLGGHRRYYRVDVMRLWNERNGEEAA